MVPHKRLMLSALSIAMLPAHVLYALPKDKGGAGASKPAAPVVENAGPAPADNQPAAALTTTAAAFAAAVKETYAIEDDIPLPVKSSIGVRGESQYPYEKMGVGQSFFVPVSDKMKEPWKTVTSLSSRKTREFWPKRFVTERQTKDGVEGVRVWRQEDGTGPVPEKRTSPKKTAAAPAAETGDKPSGDPQTGAEAPQTAA